MIKSIVIRNFQSHKKTILKFHPGVNVISGPSNQGKTAIFRALNWVKDNRPSIIPFISTWDRDDKGNATEPVIVKVKNDKATIQRISGKMEDGEKKKDFNGYIYDIENNPVQLNAVGMDVPEQITSLLNLSEVNIQEQLDAPFLLSQSASDVGRFLNKEIRLDRIDVVLSRAEKKRRNLNQEIKQCESTASEIESELKDYTYIDDAEKLIAQLKAVQDKKETIEKTISDLNDFADSYDELVESSKKYDSVDFNEAEKIIARLSEISAQKKDHEKTAKDLEQLQTEHEYEVSEISEMKSVMKTLSKELPDVCPMCNGTGKMKDHICVE